MTMSETQFQTNIDEAALDRAVRQFLPLLCWPEMKAIEFWQVRLRMPEVIAEYHRQRIAA